jgi:single-stranded-DNA-specific exonuclease
LSRHRWKLHPPVPGEFLAKLDAYPALLVQLLYNRGITDSAQIEPFLRADRRLLLNPFSLPDMDKASARIYQALLSGEKIAVYGDFDADGICGTALLVQGLSLLGGRVVPYIPHRLEEGHGLNHTALERLRQQGVTLVITVDCGITSFSEVERAKKAGLDIIITDHHSPPSQLPRALAVLDPKRAECAYPFPELAGVGVAFKLLQGLFQILGRENQLDKFLDLVAVGTVADMTPLVAENRYLVKQGLKVLNETERIGLQQLVSRAGLHLGGINVEDISWILGPRLNAAGRLEHAITSYNLLMTHSPEEAQSLARELEQKNAQRQKLVGEVLAQAREQLWGKGGDSLLLLVKGEDFPPGVVGLVASRLAEEFYRPAIVLQVSGKRVRGSARSIPEFDIIAALLDCQELLSRAGGHPRAAGFSLPAENLTILEQRLLQRAQAQLAHLDLRPELVIDAEISLSSLSEELLQLVERLAPFGQGNPPPAFLSREVRVLECRSVGSKGEHLKMKFEAEGKEWHGIGFDLGHLITQVASRVDIVYTLEIDHRGGKETLQLHLLDFAPSSREL